VGASEGSLHDAALTLALEDGVDGWELGLRPAVRLGSSMRCLWYRWMSNRRCLQHAQWAAQSVALSQRLLLPTSLSADKLPQLAPFDDSAPLHVALLTADVRAHAMYPLLSAFIKSARDGARFKLSLYHINSDPAYLEVRDLPVGVFCCANLWFY
jgi:hypothetical protein